MNDRLLPLRALCLVLMLAVYACTSPTETEAPIRSVRTMRVEPVTETVSRQTFAGFTRAAMETRLSFRVAGKIVELAVEEGEIGRAHV